MELSNLWYFVLFLIPCMYICINKFGIGKKKDISLPPGTSGLPFIGESLGFNLKFRKGALSEFISERMLRYSSKIFRTSLLGQNVVVMSSAEGNKFIFTNEGNLVKSWYPIQLDKLFHKSGEHNVHVQGKIIRNVLRPRFLKVGGLQDCVRVVDTVAKQHLEAYRKDDDQLIIKGSEMAQRFGLGAVCGALFRINDLSEIEQFVEKIKAIEGAFVAIPINLPGTAWNRGLKASKLMKSRLEALIKERKENEFFADLIATKGENGESMSLNDIAFNCVALIDAGYTSAQTTITMLIKALADHPHVYDSVLQARNSKFKKSRRWS